MSHRFKTSAGAVAAVTAVLWSGSIRGAGQTAQPAAGTSPDAVQTPPAPRPAAAKRAGPSTANARWTPPRTPWGDPDISGNFTNVFEQATPLERPDQFAGVARDEIKGQQLSDLLTRRRDQSLANFDSSDIHAPTFWWGDALRVEKGSHAWFVVDPPDGKIPPITPEAQRRIAARAEARRLNGRGAADSYEDRSLYDRCITRGMPNSMMPTIYGNSYRIVQSQGLVAIQYEMIHETRVIPLDGRAHVGQGIRMDMGDGRGHWEGDTLVVETTNFRERSAFRNGNPDTLRIIERFRRVAPDQVQWAVTVEDPATWTRPWSFSMPLTMDDSEQMFEYGCHEGNLGLSNILSGARADEKTADEAAKRGITVAPRAIPTAAEGER